MKLILHVFEYLTNEEMLRKLDVSKKGCSYRDKKNSLKVNMCLPTAIMA